MEKNKIISFRPKFQELRDARTYTEVQVKDILFNFARDIGCKWRRDKLRKYIDTVFDFD